jgi:NADH-quinone oxidoreductase subunit J
MIAHSIFFYTFSLIAIVSAIMVTASKNTVHSVFFLILDFISISCLFIMIGAEFLGMIMLIVYVGAVAVLFLFVVMMLDFKISLDKNNILQYLPIGFFVGLIFISELMIVLINTKFDLSNIQILVNPMFKFENLTNTEAIGSILYTDYILYFQLSGVILLVAMIGSIVLTLRTRDGVKRQSIQSQLDRNYKSTITLVDPKSNEGVDI